MKSLITAMLILGSVSVFASTEGSHPCKEIKAACETAGFKKGDHKEKKGLYKDCVQPIMAGQTVPGVTVASDVVTACKDKKVAHHK
jgi:hypothetical protein